MEKGAFFMNVTILDNIKGRFGFGCMRLPMQGEEVDIEETKRMVDAFMAAGLNYFDTAHVYLSGKSELAVKECLTSRYPRASYVLADKLTSELFSKEEDILPLFQKQLECCGVDYFDIYLMHAVDRHIYPQYENTRAFEILSDLKKQGKIRRMGLSYHDSGEFLDKILTEHPEIDVVQIQFNYVDYEDATVQSRLVYEACEKHGKPIIVMEPVKGGGLVKLPEEAQEIFDDLNAQTGHTYSNAAYALRFAASFPQIAMVLSGMGSKEQMLDNLSAMQPPQPLDEAEKEAIRQVTEVFRGLHLIPCTACHYCTDGCPMQIQIPDLFAVLNAKNVFHDGIANYYYENSLTVGGHGKASDCIECGHCEGICPQHLPVIELLKQVSEVFDKKA